MTKSTALLIALAITATLVKASPLYTRSDYVNFEKPFNVTLTMFCDDDCMNNHERDWIVTREIPNAGGVMGQAKAGDYPDEKVSGYHRVGEVQFQSAKDDKDPKVFFADRERGPDEKTFPDDRHWRCEVKIEEDGILGTSNFQYTQLTLNLGDILKPATDKGFTNYEIIQYKCDKDIPPPA